MRPPPKMEIRILRREVRTARRTKTIITIAFKKVGIIGIKMMMIKIIKKKIKIKIKIKITMITAERATTAKTHRISLSPNPACYFTVKIGCSESVPD